MPDHCFFSTSRKVTVIIKGGGQVKQILLRKPCTICLWLMSYLFQSKIRILKSKIEMLYISIADIIIYKKSKYQSRLSGCIGMPAKAAPCATNLIRDQKNERQPCPNNSMSKMSDSQPDSGRPNRHGRQMRQMPHRAADRCGCGRARSQLQDALHRMRR